MQKRKLRGYWLFMKSMSNIPNYYHAEEASFQVKCFAQLCIQGPQPVCCASNMELCGDLTSRHDARTICFGK